MRRVRRRGLEPVDRYAAVLIVCKANDETISECIATKSPVQNVGRSWMLVLRPPSVRYHISQDAKFDRLAFGEHLEGTVGVVLGTRLILYYLRMPIIENTCWQ